VLKSVFHLTQVILIMTGWLGVLILGMPLLPGCNSPTRDAAVQTNPSPEETVSVATLPPPNRSLGADGENSSLAVVAYYFHRTVRCPGCLQIEFMADQAIRQSFPQELQNGKLLWLSINMDELENQSYVKEYKLNASDLVLVDVRKNGSRDWKKLGKVWELHGDRETFNQYLRTEIANFLADEKK